MEKYRKNLILSADDFDSNQNAKNSILLLAEAGKIDRVSVIIDEQFAPEDIDRLLRSKVKIDLHLMLSGLRANHHSFGESALKRATIFILGYFIGKITGPKTEKDWARQIEKFKEVFGHNPDGLNSHQHIHFFPPFFKIILRLAKKNNISYVRFGEKLLSDSCSTAYYILLILNKLNWRHFRNSGLFSPDYIASLDWIKNFNKFLEELPNGKTELVCHPERKAEFDFLQKHF